MDGWEWLKLLEKRREEKKLSSQIILILLSFLFLGKKRGVKKEKEKRAEGEIKT